VCHETEHGNWINSGHPYKINAKADVVAGTAYPQWVQDLRGESWAVDDDFFTDPSGAELSINANTFPSGGWDDVSYVIGGYGWKARFIGNDGYIITGQTDDLVQYNPPLDYDYFGGAAYADLDASASTYHSGEQKPYTCGTCHTTGWIADSDAATDGDLTDNQDGLEGIHGTWVETGIGCEACHGPSAGHAADPYNVPVSESADDSCGNCHIRNDPYEIDTSGGFVRHHEQYEELIQGKHSSLGCVGCHQPHSPVRFGDEWVRIEGSSADPTDAENVHGVRVDCQSCHWREAAEYATWGAATPGMAGVDCVQCHMPRATKSAVKAGPFSGDTRTHLFGVNIFVDPITNPELSTTGAAPANNYISLDFACGACHTDTAGGTDTANPDFWLWATTALQANGGVHGGN